jgi:DNA-dependent RNA polymerase auxiliary subunit epsilon
MTEAKMATRGKNNFQSTVRPSTALINIKKKVNLRRQMKDSIFDISFILSVSSAISAVKKLF